MPEKNKDQVSAPNSSAASPATPAKPKSVRAKVRMTYQKWERYTVWPMFILSVAFVGLTAFIISPPKGITFHTRLLLTFITLFLWGLFIADYLVRLALSPDRKKFLKEQSFEFLTLVVPYLRPFLLIRYVWELSYFRSQGGDGLRRRALIAIGIFALSYVYTISTLVWVVERNHPKATILNWGDSIWWGFVTISTVGYGVYYPVTVLGRLLAVLMMLGGLFVIGVVSATIISGFNQAMTSFLADAAPKSKQESVEHGRALVEALSMGAMKEETFDSSAGDGSTSTGGSDSSPPVGATAPGDSTTS